MPSPSSGEENRDLRRPEGDVRVSPVPEHRADAELAPVYRDVKATLGVPWVGVIAQAVARYRPLFMDAWQQFQPSARTHFLESRCDGIRLQAWEQMADALDIEPQRERLRELGYSHAELAQIRETLDVFDYGNPKYLVLATAIQQSLCHGVRLGGRSVGDPRDTMPRPPIHQTGPIPVMVEEHHAFGGLSDLYADMKTTLQLPFVNSDYKAMARWPTYLALAWRHLKPHIDTAPYHRVRQGIHEQALATAEGLPYPYLLDQARALRLGLTGEQVHELRAVISLFQWLLSGLVINVTFFKRALIGKGD